MLEQALNLPKGSTLQPFTTENLVEGIQVIVEPLIGFISGTITKVNNADTCLVGDKEVYVSQIEYIIK